MGVTKSDTQACGSLTASEKMKVFSKNVTRSGGANALLTFGLKRLDLRQEAAAHCALRRKQAGGS